MSSRNSVRLWIFIFQFLSRINSTFNIFSQLKSFTIQKVSKVDLTETHHTPFSFPPFHHLQKEISSKKKKESRWNSQRHSSLSVSRNDNRGRNSCSRSRGIDLVRRPFQLAHRPSLVHYLHPRSEARLVCEAATLARSVLRRGRAALNSSCLFNPVQPGASGPVVLLEIPLRSRG